MPVCSTVQKMSQDPATVYLQAMARMPGYTYACMYTHTLFLDTFTG